MKISCFDFERRCRNSKSVNVAGAQPVEASDTMEATIALEFISMVLDVRRFPRGARLDRL